MRILSQSLPGLSGSHCLGGGAPTACPPPASPAPTGALCLLWLISSFLSASRDLCRSRSQPGLREGRDLSLNLGCVLQCLGETTSTRLH